MSSYFLFKMRDHHGLSWIILDYHGLSWIVMDYHICFFSLWHPEIHTHQSGGLLTTDVRCPLGLKPHPAEPNPGKVTGIPKGSRIDYQLTKQPFFRGEIAVKLQGCILSYTPSKNTRFAIKNIYIIKFQEKKHLPLQTYEKIHPKIWRMLFFGRKTNISKTTKTFPFVIFPKANLE